MVKAACNELDVDPGRCVVVGDIGSDVAAAQAAGARGILVPTRQTRVAEVDAAAVVEPSLSAAARRVLRGDW